MIEVNDAPGIKRLALGFGILSLISLLVTAWVLSNVSHERQAVIQLVNHLQGNDLKVANELSNELGLQQALTLLLVVNVIATTVAFTYVVRNYFSSERNLRDVKVLSEDILASMDAGVITTDLNGRILGMNPRSKELLGIFSDENVATTRDLGTEHAVLADLAREVSEKQITIRDRDYRVTRDGHNITLRAGCTMLRDRQKEEIGMVLHVRDVTEKALMEERLRRMERYMGLGSLAAGLQHEIKNPLSALSLHVQLLCERMREKGEDKEVADILEILRTEVRRIGSVLDGFRNYAVIHDLGRTPVDVRYLIQKLIRLLRPDAERKNVVMELETAPDCDCLIQADATKLEQVLLNLALNAFAAMPNGGALRFCISTQANHLRIDVSDTGNGIPTEIQSKIFDPYFTTRNDGTGMGLAICDKIVRQHDGSIDFESSPAGTTFRVILPVGN
jgi:two-component system nitrogen regulation sensor histidine kinase GlnL